MFEEATMYDLSSDWIEKIVNLLKELNIRFEAEEGVRVHKNDVIIEIAEKNRRFVVTVSVEVPKYLTLDEVERYAKAYRDFLEVFAKVGIEPFYELDASIGYTFLRGIVEVEDIDSLTSLLKKALT